MRVEIVGYSASWNKYNTHIYYLSNIKFPTLQNRDSLGATHEQNREQRPRLSANRISLFLRFRVLKGAKILGSEETLCSTFTYHSK